MNLQDLSSAYPDTLDELSKFIFTSKYARYREDLQRRETWFEAVQRVEDMHLRKFSDLAPEHIAEINWAFDKVRNKQVLPSMRSMQYGGIAVEAQNARIYNCAVRHVDSARAFAELFHLLLCGCGTGIGLTRKYLDRLPDIAYPNNDDVVDYRIADSIEGWADSLEVLLNSFFVGNPWSGKRVNFIFDDIREEGSPLKTGGGKAPGPEPLRQALQLINSLLSVATIMGQTRLTSIDAYDILMHAADAVLSGGVRRSATSIMFDKDDEQLLNAKTGNWWETHPHRGRSNNSVLLIRDQIEHDEFAAIFNRTKEWGEPGYVFAENEDMLFNPCFEISFIPVTDDGEAAVQFCNLTSINGGEVQTSEDFYEYAKAAAIIGTLQASYTDFPYLSEAARELTEKEALLGVSITGMMENPNVILDPETQRKGSQIVLDTNVEWAAILGINPAARACAIKPEGTGSMAVKTTRNGIHAAHDEWYFRRVRMNRNENIFKYMEQYNSHLIEPAIGSDLDAIVTFPIHAQPGGIFKKDLTAIQHLEIVRSTQENWVIPGTSEFNTKPITHNVSCTIIVQPDEWDEVRDYLYQNRGSFAAVSLLAASGDKDYQQAPFEAVSTEQDKELFHFYMQNFIPMDYSYMVEHTDETNVMAEAACGGGKCEV